MHQHGFNIDLDGPISNLLKFDDIRQGIYEWGFFNAVDINNYTLFFTCLKFKRVLF